jgi:thiamine-monophosphate kinase
MKLSELGEFALIERVATGRGSAADPRVLRGVGDDCAVIEAGEGMLRLVTTDMLVEGIHFDLKTTSPSDLGAKAVAVNLSDVAAMGGRPLEAYISLALPPTLELAWVERLYAGIDAQAAAAGVSVLGGDTTASGRDLVINVALVGEVQAGQVLYRDGARPGDRVFVSGTLGEAAAGLDALQRGFGDEPAARGLVTRQLLPQPHLEQAAQLAASGLVHAMIDVSDGVAADLGHICAASGVGCRLERRLVEAATSEELRAYCRRRDLDPLALALGGGEDYVLLLTGDPALVGALESLHELGEITAADERLLLDGASGAATPLAGGWDHFGVL